MNAKEVELQGKALSKAVAEQQPSSAIMKILNDLKSGVKPTEDLLRQSRIGIQVNKLRQHNDPAVKNLSHELVSKWKDEVNRAKKKAPNGAASPAQAPSGTASPAPPKAKKHNVPPEQRNHKTDKVDCGVTGDATRDNCLKLMYDGLAFMSEDPPQDILNVARDVEAAAYAHFNKTLGTEYKGKIRSLFQNLKNKSNQQLRKRVLSGEISPKRLITMSHDELKSAERRAADAKLEKENMNEAMVAQVEKSISTEFTCGKCKQKKVSYSQAQTRSADEPMTTFCECMNCGNRWKFS